MRSIALRIFSLYQYRNQSKSYRWISFALRMGITIAVLVYVGQKIATEGAAMWTDLSTWGATNWLWVSLSIGLLPLNIYCEAEKWRTLIKPYYTVSVWTCMKAVLTGLSTGIFTPNRIGEYAGRIWYLPRGHRTEAVVLTFINRMGQMFITLLGGSLALGYLVKYQTAELSRLVGEHFSSVHLILYLSFTILLFASILIFLPQNIHKLLSTENWRFPRLKQAWNTLGSIHSTQLLISIGFGGLRYIVFSFQYYFLLLAFGYAGAWVLAIALIALVFFIKSILPSLALTELGIRETVAISVMGAWALPTLITFGSTFLLYVINIVLPALMGLFLLKRLKF